jgi:hypothetical protein
MLVARSQEKGVTLAAAARGVVDATAGRRRP